MQSAKNNKTEEVEAFPGLSLGPLPSPDQLSELKRRGVLNVVNVSGCSLLEIYGDSLLADFQLHEYEFIDAFSQELSPEDWVRFRLGQLPTVFVAMNTLGRLLASGEVVHCCCHGGVSRSSLVAAGGLMLAFNLEPAVAREVVVQRNPPAKFTARSLQTLDEFARRLAGE